MSSLILAIEPDRRQAAKLGDLIRRRVSADLVHADTTERALAALAEIGDRVPDLVLVPSLLSPQEDAALAGALRVIAAAANVRMLTIPVLADSEQTPAHRGLFARWRARPAPRVPGACDPAVFAEQISAYLAERDAEHAAALDDAVDALDDAVDPLDVAVDPIASDRPETQFGTYDHQQSSHPRQPARVSEPDVEPGPAFEAPLYAEPVAEQAFTESPATPDDAPVTAAAEIPDSPPLEERVPIESAREAASAVESIELTSTPEPEFAAMESAWQREDAAASDDTALFDAAVELETAAQPELAAQPEQTTAFAFTEQPELAARVELETLPEIEPEIAIEWPAEEEAAGELFAAAEIGQPESDPQPQPEIDIPAEEAPEIERQPEPEPEPEVEREPEPEPQPDPEVERVPIPQPEIEELPEPAPEVEHPPAEQASALGSAFVEEWQAAAPEIEPASSDTLDTLDALGALEGLAEPIAVPVEDPLEQNELDLETLRDLDALLAAPREDAAAETDAPVQAVPLIDTFEPGETVDELEAVTAAAPDKPASAVAPLEDLDTIAPLEDVATLEDLDKVAPLEDLTTVAALEDGAAINGLEEVEPPPVARVAERRHFDDVRTVPARSRDEEVDPLTVDALIAPLLREMEAARHRSLKPVEAARAEDVNVAEPQMLPPARPTHRAPDTAAAPQVEPVRREHASDAPASTPASGLTMDLDPMFFADDWIDDGAPAKKRAARRAKTSQPAPVERPAWVELIESLRQDIERLKAERAEPSTAAGAAPETPRVARPQMRRRRATEDQWGLFDPNQCGFGALLAKLDEINGREETSQGA